MVFGSGNGGTAGNAVERETADRTPQNPKGAVKTEDVTTLFTPLHTMALEPAEFKGSLVVWGAVPRPKGHTAASAGIRRGLVTIIIIFSLARGGSTRRARPQRRGSSSYGIFVARMGVMVMLMNVMVRTATVKWDKAMHGGRYYVEMRLGPCTVRLGLGQWSRRGSKGGVGAQLIAVVNATTMSPAPGSNSSRR